MNKFIGKICPYCKTAIKEGEDIVMCSSCEMPHHKECWIENQGCTTFGCLGTIQSVDGSPIAPPAAPHMAQPTRGFFCIKCGTQLRYGDRFCMQCGAPVAVRPQQGFAPQYPQPQYTQPRYPQPQYAQPQYTQPQYTQPQYPQQQYTQPQYPQQQYVQQQQYPQPPTVLNGNADNDDKNGQNG